MSVCTYQSSSDTLKRGSCRQVFVLTRPCSVSYFSKMYVNLCSVNFSVIVVYAGDAFRRQRAVCFSKYPSYLF